MRRTIIAALALALCITGAAAKDKKDKKEKKKTPVPALVATAQYVYVTAYDGDENSPNVLPAERSAIAATRDALRKWGRYKLAYSRESADLMFVVRAPHGVPGGMTGGGVHVETGRPPAPASPTTHVALGGPDEEELAVFLPQSGTSSAPLWRGLMPNGLQGPNPPLIERLRADVNQTDRILEEQAREKQQQKQQQQAQPQKKP